MTGLLGPGSIEGLCHVSRKKRKQGKRFMYPPPLALIGAWSLDAGFFTVSGITNGKTRLPKMAVFDVIFNDKLSDLKDLLRSDPKCANSIGWHGLTPLHQAVLKNNQECVDLLLEHGANVNQPNSFGETPLHFACQAASLQCVHKFVEIGADLRAEDSAGRTCIHHAAKSGSV